MSVFCTTFKNNIRNKFEIVFFRCTCNIVESNSWHLISVMNSKFHGTNIFFPHTKERKKRIFPTNIIPIGRNASLKLLHGSRAWEWEDKYWNKEKHTLFRNKKRRREWLDWKIAVRWMLSTWFFVFFMCLILVYCFLFFYSLHRTLCVDFSCLSHRLECGNWLCVNMPMMMMMIMIMPTLIDFRPWNAIWTEMILHRKVKCMSFGSSTDTMGITIWSSISLCGACFFPFFLLMASSDIPDVSLWVHISCVRNEWWWFLLFFSCFSFIICNSIWVLKYPPFFRCWFHRVLVFYFCLHCNGFDVRLWWLLSVPRVCMCSFAVKLIC